MDTTADPSPLDPPFKRKHRTTPLLSNRPDNDKTDMKDITGGGEGCRTSTT